MGVFQFEIEDSAALLRRRYNKKDRFFGNVWIGPKAVGLSILLTGHLLVRCQRLPLLLRISPSSSW